MIWELFESNFHHSSDEVAVITPTTRFSWKDIYSSANESISLQSDLAGRRVGLVFNPNSAGFGMAAACEKLNADAFLLDANLSADQIQDIAADFQLNAIIKTHENIVAVERLTAGDELVQDATVTILTSGTTGKPKAVKHTWQSLSRPVRKSESNARWLLTFRPHLYAGLQVILQAFMNRATLVVSDVGATPDALVGFMQKSQVAFVSSTPSFWRRIFLSVSRGNISRLRLLQITLGGEIVDQPLLSNLKGCFPEARLIHIYATTELGRCFSVSDGLAGFPVSFLATGPDGIQLRVEEDELWVRSKNSMAGYDRLSGIESAVEKNDWFRTGDRVKIENDRVLFQGRDSDIINVGGNKVNPLIVESLIRELPQVADVRIYAISSSIAGQIVACDVVVNDKLAPTGVEGLVREICTEKLDRFHVPRIIKTVEAIELNSAGKTKRSDT